MPSEIAVASDRHPDDQQPLRRARDVVLQRDRGRVDVRERLVGLVDGQREEREDRADAARGDGREDVGRTGDRRVREHEDRAEAELEERRQEIAESRADERRPRLREKRV